MDKVDICMMLVLMVSLFFIILVYVGMVILNGYANTKEEDIQDDIEEDIEDGFYGLGLTDNGDEKEDSE